MRNEDLTPRETPIAQGDTAPNFSLLDQTRAEWRLSTELKKGAVVLCFYPMDFSPVCTEEMESIEAMRETLANAGITPVGISCDSFFVHGVWAEQLGLSHALLADMHREVCKAYGFYFPDLNIASRGTVVIGTDGTVKWSQARELKNAMDLDEILAVASA